MAQHNDFAIYRGEDILITFTLSPVVNISGWTMTFQVRRAIGDPTVLLAITPTLTTPASGICTVAISSAQTLSLSAGPYPCSLTRTDSGSAALLSEGTLKVQGSTYLA